MNGSILGECWWDEIKLNLLYRDSAISICLTWEMLRCSSEMSSEWKKKQKKQIVLKKSNVIGGSGSHIDSIERWLCRVEHEREIMMKKTQRRVDKWTECIAFEECWTVSHGAVDTNRTRQNKWSNRCQHTVNIVARWKPAGQTIISNPTRTGWFSAPSYTVVSQNK